VPSIEVAAKIADALGVTIDYLVTDGQYEQIDNETLEN
jgi:transcriptional regulator with XRE-family HTH domain